MDTPTTSIWELFVKLWAKPMETTEFRTPGLAVQLMLLPTPAQVTTWQRKVFMGRKSSWKWKISSKSRVRQNFASIDDSRLKHLQFTPPQLRWLFFDVKTPPFTNDLVEVRYGIPQNSEVFLGEPQDLHPGQQHYHDSDHKAKSSVEEDGFLNAKKCDNSKGTCFIWIGSKWREMLVWKKWGGTLTKMDDKRYFIIL